MCFFVKNKKKGIYTNMKKWIALLLAICLVAGNTVLAKDEKTVGIEEINEMLRDSNMPEDKIDELDDETKRFIYENSLSKGNVEYVEVKEENTATLNARAQDAISESELKLSVTAFKVDGQNRVDVYPAYQWLTPVKPKGKDSFGYSLSSSFSVVPDKRSNIVWYKERADLPWKQGENATYTGASLTGYQHTGKSLGTPTYPIYIKGNFYYQVDIDVSSPVKKIVMGYANDMSTGVNLSYGFQVGVFSLGFSSTSSSVRYLSKVLEFSY